MLLSSRLEKYYSVSRLYLYSTICYGRVSTPSQDLEKQFKAAKKLVENLGIPDEEITWIKDDGVSAYKTEMSARPGLQELLSLVRLGKVKRIIVYSRDRLARNFYEYVAIVKEFYKYEVEVIFTSSNSAPFSDDLMIESIYGAMSQSEGNNISTRTQDTLNLFPNSVFGLIKSEKGQPLNYQPNPKTEKILSAMFKAVAQVKTEEELFSTLNKYKKKLKIDYHSDLVRYLSNPFYCAHSITNERLSELEYVVPIITLSLYKKVQKIMKDMHDSLENALITSSNHAFAHPNCSICKKPMTFRYGDLGESGYFVCRRNHAKFSIKCVDLNMCIKSQLGKILEHIDTDVMKAELFRHLKRIENQNMKALNELNNRLKRNHLIITDKYELLKSDDPIFENTKKLKEKIGQCDLQLKEITNARDSIIEHISLIKKQLVDSLKDYDFYYIINLFFSKIEVAENSLVYHTALTKYFKDGDVIV